MSLDAKAPVHVGPLARGGKRRVQTAAGDHDFQPEARVTPGGLWVPTLDALFVSGGLSPVPSDCLADCLTQWWEAVRERFGAGSTLVSNLDNGPENQSRRPPCMRRMVDWVHHSRLHVRVA
jgi:Rhodopirellula transposase DDE domain